MVEGVFIPLFSSNVCKVWSIQPYIHIYSLCGDRYLSFDMKLTIILANVMHNNIERLTAHTIVSLPYPKQWKLGHTSDFIMIKG